MYMYIVTIMLCLQCGFGFTLSLYTITYCCGIVDRLCQAITAGDGECPAQMAKVYRIVALHEDEFEE